MNSINLTKLQKKEMIAVVGGDKPKCSCSCSCACEGEDTTYEQNRQTRNEGKAGLQSYSFSESSTGNNPKPPTQK